MKKIHISIFLSIFLFVAIFLVAGIIAFHHFSAADALSAPAPTSITCPSNQFVCPESPSMDNWGTVIQQCCNNGYYCSKQIYLDLTNPLVIGKGVCCKEKPVPVNNSIPGMQVCCSDSGRTACVSSAGSGCCLGSNQTCMIKQGTGFCCPKIKSGIPNVPDIPQACTNPKTGEQNCCKADQKCDKLTGNCVLDKKICCLCVYKTVKYCFNFNELSDGCRKQDNRPDCMDIRDNENKNVCKWVDFSNTGDDTSGFCAANTRVCDTYGGGDKCEWSNEDNKCHEKNNKASKCADWSEVQTDCDVGPFTLPYENNLDAKLKNIANFKSDHNCTDSNSQLKLGDF